MIEANKLDHIACFFEQIYPYMIEPGTIPGESFKRLYSRLANEEITTEDTGLIVALINRLAELPPDTLITVLGLFERDLMHNRLKAH